MIKSEETFSIPNNNLVFHFSLTVEFALVGQNQKPNLHFFFLACLIICLKQSEKMSAQDNLGKKDQKKKGESKPENVERSEPSYEMVFDIFSNHSIHILCIMILLDIILSKLNLLKIFYFHVNKMLMT